MASPALATLAANILANTLTVAEQTALVEALSVIAPAFPQPDDVAGVRDVEGLSGLWFATLFAINAEGGGMPPPGDFLTDVTGTPPIVVTSPTTTTRNAAITPATDGAAGSMSAADKSKLDGLSPGVTSIGVVPPLTSTGGATPLLAITAATEADAGSMSAADKSKLDAIVPGPPAPTSVRNTTSWRFETTDFFLFIAVDNVEIGESGNAIMTLTVPVNWTTAVGFTFRIIFGVDLNSVDGSTFPCGPFAGDGDTIVTAQVPVSGLLPGPHTFNAWVGLTGGTAATATVPGTDDHPYSAILVVNPQ
jgi:hypothetical protein